MTASAIIAKKVEERGISISELARRVNLNNELLRRSLNGDRKLPADEMVALCKELDLKISDFV